MRAAIAVGLEPYYVAEAKERQRRSGSDRVSAQKMAQDIQKKHRKTQFLVLVAAHCCCSSID
jgi:hypothetical protein